MRLWAVTCIIGLLSGILAAEDSLTPVDGYTPQVLEGWTVYVSDELRQQRPEETERALGLLRGQCNKVIHVVPSAVVADLKKVKLWLSLPTGDRRPRAEFHPSKDWLIEHGMHPEKEKGVEFTNTAILEEEIILMPMLLLHELSHAYHNLVLGFDHPGILRLFEKAKASGSYDLVKRHNREPQKAYAITNHKEYFAECTEAFLGENDFYPFNSRQLKEHDPEMYQLLTEIWIQSNNDGSDE